MSPDFSEENKLIVKGYARIAGVDEVGRGALAGPVVAAAVILDARNIPDGLNDSKVLPAIDRRRLVREIQMTAIYAIGEVSAEVIDQINIAQAALLAMKGAILALKPAPDFVLIDGISVPVGLEIPATALKKGDSRSHSIAAASIVAKEKRDRVMRHLARRYPDYGWEKNVGYGTKMHRAALEKIGVTPYHRRTFEPVCRIAD
ncbi:MAG: ribonuclease HII [Aestuariivita sp.]|nr:ribonuclease HII [Aestuariivita sp.]